DIESQPFLEAARQVRHAVGRENIFFIHCSLVPYLGTSGELKTKPTQHSVAELRSIGIVPDAVVLRCDRDVPQGLKHKIALMADVEEEGVVSCPDSPSIYDIPEVLYKEHLDTFVIRKLGLPYRDVDWEQWGDLLERVRNPQREVTVGIAWVSTLTCKMRICQLQRLLGTRRLRTGQRPISSGLPQMTVRMMQQVRCVG